MKSKALYLSLQCNVTWNVYAHITLAGIVLREDINNNAIAWFPETAVIPPQPPDTHELLIAAIKEFLTAIQKYNLAGELLPPTLVQDLQDLASSLYN